MQQEFDIIKQLKVLWRFKLVLILVVVIAGGAAWGLAATRPAMYQATTTVIVENQAPNLGNMNAGLQSMLGFSYMPDMRSQIEVMRSRAVLERAITQIDPKKAANPDYLHLEAMNLSKSFDAQQVPGTSMVKLTVTAAKPDTAIRLANAVAEAYVDESSRSKLTAIETALSNTTQRLKDLSTGRVDLSINPYLSVVNAKINAALAAVQTATDRLKKISGRKDPQTAKTIPDAGTTLTAVQLSSMTQQIDAVAVQANEISALARKLDFQPLGDNYEAYCADLATMESQSRSLGSRLGTLSGELDKMRGVEIDPLVSGQLLVVNEQLRVANTTAIATLTQVSALYSVEEQLRVSTANAGAIIDQLALLYGVGQEARLAGVIPTSVPTQAVAQQRETSINLIRRVVQHSKLTATEVGAASDQIKKVAARIAPAKQLPSATLSDSMAATSDKLSDSAASASAVLNELTKKLRPSDVETGVYSTNAEVAAMAMRASMASASLTFMLSQMDKLQYDQLNPQIYTEFLGVREWVQVASDASRGLPEEIANLARGSGDGLSYTALDTMRQQLQMVLLTSAGGGSRVTDSATDATTTGDLFKRFRNVILAMIAGLLLATMCILGLQYFDHTVRDGSQVSGYTGLPMLARLTKAGKGNPHPPSILDESPQYLEDFRMLRTTLGLDSSSGQALLVTGTAEGEGKTTVAANLARSVALQGRRVLVIDGNLRKPGIGALFNMDKEDGLSRYLAGDRQLKDYVKNTEGIDVLPVALPSSRSAELLSSARMGELLNKAKQEYDVVIVDSTSLNSNADTLILAKRVDDVLLVLQPGASKLEMVRQAKETLESSGIKVSGFVLNKIEQRQPAAA